MQRLLLVAVTLLLLAAVLASDSSGSFGMTVKDDGDATATEDGTQNTTIVQPADDFGPKSDGGHGNENDEGPKAVPIAPSGGNGGELSEVAVAVIISVTLVALALGAGMVACVWRASRREEEAMFMDLGDERNYPYGRFGDYAAM
ncbi:hypothetical protein PInf_011314 [Phytophthora infestans]|nr:hypothetical protein PInf_011314 [Phytophthora infestans]